MQIRKQDLFFWYALLLSAGLLSICVLRAVAVGVTYDEAWTLTGFVPFSYTDILSFTPCDANNHLLNTLLIRFLYGVFPNTLFIARLPNLLAGLLFTVYAYKLTKNYSGPLRYFAYSFLLFNPFLFEFFSLARGYGLGMGFLMTALYYLSAFSAERQTKNLLLSSLCLLLLSASMLSSLHLVLPAYGLLAVLVWQQKENRFKNSVILLLLVTCNILLLLEPIIKLRENTSFYYGGASNIFSDTFVSLGKYFVGSPVADGTLVFVLGLVHVTIAAVLLRHALNYKKYSLHQYLFAILLVLSISSVVLQFYLLHTPYIIDRTALFLYPLLALALAEGLAQVNSPKWLGIVFIGFTVAILLNFLGNLNFYKTKLWFFDAHSEEIVQTLKEKTNGNHCSLQFSWPLRKSLEYYRDGHFENLKLDYKLPYRAVLDGDYVLFLGSGIDQVDYAFGYDVLNLYEKDTVLSFPAEKLYLFKLKPQH